MPNASALRAQIMLVEFRRQEIVEGSDRNGVA
jgi:hypothetical protein